MFAVEVVVEVGNEACDACNMLAEACDACKVAAFNAVRCAASDCTCCCALLVEHCCCCCCCCYY